MTTNPSFLTWLSGFLRVRVELGIKGKVEMEMVAKSKERINRKMREDTREKRTRFYIKPNTNAMKNIRYNTILFWCHFFPFIHIYSRLLLQKYRSKWVGIYRVWCLKHYHTHILLYPLIPSNTRAIAFAHTILYTQTIICKSPIQRKRS